MVRAVIDWRRCGLTRPIPRETVERFAGFFLLGVDLTPESLREGLAWANQGLPSGVRLLSYANIGDNTGYVPTDPLLDFDDGERPLTDAVWSAVLSLVSGAETLNVARAAYLRGNIAGNEVALMKAQQLSDEGISSQASYNLGGFAHEPRDGASRKGRDYPTH